MSATSQEQLQLQQATAKVGTIKLDATQEKVARVFKSRVPNIGYIFPNGKRAVFISPADGKPAIYATRLRGEIQHLEDEVANGHPVIYIDDSDKEIEQPLPIEALREKIIAEYLAQHKTATNPDNDAGTTDVTKLVPANTRSIQDAAAGSTGTDGTTAGGLKINIQQKQ